MVENLLFALWFFLPAGFANASPVFANRIPIINKFDTQIDFGAKIGDKQLLGKNKTWRGLLFGIAVAVATLALQKLIFNNSVWLQQSLPTTVDYSTVSLWLGVLLGLGALVGDAVESFLKRQMNIKSGETWFPFDQTDYIVGGLLISSIMVSLDFAQVITVFLMWFGLHLLSTYVGFSLGLKDKPI